MTTRIFIALLVFLALLALVTVVAFGERERMETFEKSHLARSIEEGAALFESNCVGCHGIQGKGIPGVAPALNDFSFFVDRLDQVGYSGSLKSYVSGALAAGRPVMSASWPAPMPTWGQAYGGPLRNDQIDDLTNYILNWQDSAIAAGPSGAVEPPVALATPVPGGAGDDPIERGKALILSQACGGCHVIEGLAGAVGEVGPDLTNIATIAQTRVEGQSAEDYIRASILNPSAYLVPECPTGPCADVMLKTYGEQLAEQDLDDIVTYLLTLD